MSPFQANLKVALLQTAATLTAATPAASLPKIDGQNVKTFEDQLATSVERWYRWLSQAALTDETVMTTPADLTPAAIVPAIAGDATQLQALAKALAPALALIPGQGGQIAAASAGVLANAPLPSVGATGAAH
jgi:hypothetical protein